jgi:hypothetical protein
MESIFRNVVTLFATFEQHAQAMEGIDKSYFPPDVVTLVQLIGGTSEYSITHTNRKAFIAAIHRYFDLRKTEGALAKAFISRVAENNEWQIPFGDEECRTIRKLYWKRRYPKSIPSEDECECALTTEWYTKTKD